MKNALTLSQHNSSVQEQEKSSVGKKKEKAVRLKHDNSVSWCVTVALAAHQWVTRECHTRSVLARTNPLRLSSGSPQHTASHSMSLVDLAHNHDDDDHDGV
jgi:hypothetical protein